MTIPSPETLTASTELRQPFLHDALLLFKAPTQFWTDRIGNMGLEPIHGIYYSDTRVFSSLALTVNGEATENIGVNRINASEDVHSLVARSVDGRGADPRVRLDRRRTVGAESVAEVLRFESRLPDELNFELKLVLKPDFGALQDVKSGLAASRDRAAPQLSPAIELSIAGDQATLERGSVQARVLAPGANISYDGGELAIRWNLTVPPHAVSEVSWTVELQDTSAVVKAAEGLPQWDEVSVESSDSRIGRWAERAFEDLNGLRMTATAAPGEVFLAAGAPWFFTLFGRDSIWAARMLLPFGTELAASTLRALAALQGTRVNPENAEQPGKIPHEIRSATLHLHGKGITLPPLYYGTVDATPLWICLLHDAWSWGLADQEVKELLPQLEAALAWMRDYSNADGFLDYRDETGHGLSNQGWKDSGDSIQWRDGRLAEGPLALCEVQGYGYEAARAGARLMRHFELPGAQEWEEWAERLKERFTESFWVGSEDQSYPAVALDGKKQKVDSLTSNIGHLLGTGILTAEQAERVSRLVSGPSLDSGLGLRTLSTEEAGYWPLSYHGGSVWAHDTAIAIWGMHREGLGQHATGLLEGLLLAAEGFDYRMPELHAGEPVAGGPVAYPAACRPQAWSAAAVAVALQTILGVNPRDRQELISEPLPGYQQLRVSGFRLAGVPLTITRDGE
ncbi:glycogen debranching enzyme [Psychromicrobium silvestre]|uniref:Glycogen debranching enzyme n=1 Tax=Psychromicrobium silvestre TaxID=1645614 RepID=A0A7Y9S7L2_9MICC|nr:glycogen debranching N-terminal domain-containing protein [Psychromicrobium silvestre]NYE96138.1 glycogen debranching enzyme [Psychromicrobium silvestre]